MTHDVMRAYHLNARSFGNLSAFYYYIYAPAQIFVGLLMDRYGPRRLLTLAALSCGLGSYLFASTDIVLVAEIGRFFIGFGSAFAFVGMLRLATIWFPVKRFAMIAGVAMSLGMVGGILGDLMLTRLVHHDGWRLSCYLLGCFSLVLAVVIYLFVRDVRPITQSCQQKSTLNFKALCLSLERLIKNPQIWVNGSIGLLMYVPVSGFAESWQIPYFAQMNNYSRHDAVTAATMVFLGWAVGGPITGWISDTIKQRRLPMTIGAAASVILLSYVLYVPDIAKATVFTLLFFYGFCSSVQVIIFPVSRELSPPALTATAFAITNMIVMLSGFSVYLVGAILESLWAGMINRGVHLYSLASYQIAFVLLPAGLLLAVFLTFFLQETYCKQAEDL